MADKLISFSSFFTFRKSETIEGTHLSSFRNPIAYLWALAHTPQRLLKASLHPSSHEDRHRVDKRSGLARVLEWHDILFFGLAVTLGGGIFPVVGQIISNHSGPAVVLSFLLAGTSALLSAACLSEASASSPSFGGAFSFVKLILGEFPAFVLVSCVLLEYLLAGSALARNFSDSFSFALGFQQDNAWRFGVREFPETFGHWDLPAAGLVIVLMILSCVNTKATSPVNLGILSMYMVMIGGMISGGVAYGDPKNFSQPSSAQSPGGFVPFGVHGVLAGAALALFSFVGYDAAASLAEECRDPNSAVPIGLMGSVGVSGLVLSAMTVVLASLLPYDKVPLKHPFTFAFQGREVFMFLVDSASSLGSILAVFVLILAASRHLAAMGRAALVSPSFSQVNGITGSPINSTLMIGTIMAAVAYAVDESSLFGLVCLLALSASSVISLSLLLKRYSTREGHLSWPAIFFVLLFLATSIAFAAVFRVHQPNPGLSIGTGVACFLEVAVFALFASEKSAPSSWHLPLMPWIPSLCLFLNVVLAGFLEWRSFRDLGIFLGILKLVYLCFSLHSAYDQREKELALPSKS